MNGPVKMTAYDKMVAFLSTRIKQYIYTQLQDVLYMIGANNHQPEQEDIDFLALLMAMYIMHTHKIDVESNAFPDLKVHKDEILSTMANIDFLKETLKAYMIYNKTGGNPFGGGPAGEA